MRVQEVISKQRQLMGLLHVTANSLERLKTEFNQIGFLAVLEGILEKEESKKRLLEIEAAAKIINDFADCLYPEKFEGSPE